MKRVGLILLMIAMIITFIGCTAAPQQEPAPPTERENAQVGEDIIDPAPSGETAVVTLYYVNNEYVETGDASLDVMIPVENEINLAGKSMEAAVVAELQKNPEDANLSTALNAIRILSVDTAEGVAYVNVSSDRLGGGSLQESLILNQLVYTLTGLDEVNAVQILVDGSKVETLMGHFFIEEPLTIEEI